MGWNAFIPQGICFGMGERDPMRNSEEKGCNSVKQRCAETGLRRYATENRQLFL
jgi:hypothetical protein